MVIHMHKCLTLRLMQSDAPADFSCYNPHQLHVLQVDSLQKTYPALGEAGAK